MDEEKTLRLKVVDVLQAAAVLEGMTTKALTCELASNLQAEAAGRGDEAKAAFWDAVEHYLMARDLAVTDEERETNERAWRSREWVDWPLPEELYGWRFVPRGHSKPWLEDDPELPF